jgi:superfamily II DNA/RNA helicase
MKLPVGVLNALKEKQIMRPTPIQMQGLPAVYEIRFLFFLLFNY